MRAMENNIRNNLTIIQAQIAQAYSRRVADNGAVELIAVSKNHPAEAVVAAHAAGINVFGESRIQETREKQRQITFPLEWHLIGHLQTNKAKLAVSCFDLIQSIDSERLADAVNVEAEKAGKIQRVLLQVNIAAEQRKHGVCRADAWSLAEYLLAKPNIELCGLMAIVPFYSDSENARCHFRDMNILFTEMRYKVGRPEFGKLSMGMSGDFAVAIEEGANIVRIGTALFGERNYN